MLLKVYRSSAGSGKTFTLVKEYLKLCLQVHNSDSAFRNILALTFTNKATAEMKNRILAGLEGLSLNPWTENVSIIGRILSEELGITDEEVQQRCSAVFRSLLHRYEDFSVLTIDKFTGKVIRSFASNLGLNQDFEIELDAEKILRQAIYNLLDRLGNDTALTMALTEFALSKAEEENSHRISKDIFSFSKSLLNEEDSLRLDYYRNFSIAGLMEIKSQLATIVKENEDKGKKIAEKTLNLIQVNNVPLEAFAYGLGGGFGVYWQKILENKGILKPKTNTLKTVESQRWTSAKGSEYQGLIESISDQLTAAFQEYQSFLDTHFSTTTIFRNALKNFNSLVVMNEVEKELLALKDRLNIVLISDFNLKISQLISGEPAPFIYEKLGQRYTNYLIDEFQDTSIMQWLNLLPLVDEALSTGNCSLLVGDSKQAIYRFRGGEVAQFAILPKIYISEGLKARKMDVQERKRFNNLNTIRERRLSDCFDLYSLTINRRSKNQIIQFNNALFRHLHKFLSERNQQIFSDYEQNETPDNIGGYVQIQLVDENESDLKLLETNLELTLKTVSDCLKDGYSPSDIAVLCKDNKVGAAVVDALLIHNYNVVSADSMLVSVSPNVKLLLSVAKSLADKSSLISKATAARYMASIWEKDTDQLINIVREEGIEGLIALTGKSVSIHYLSGLPLYDLFLETAIIFLKSIDVNTQFLLDEALIFSQRYGDHLPAFLEYFDDNSGNIKIRTTDSTQAITVMTIHKSKGLEFPIVIMPYEDSKKGKRGNKIWYDNPTGNPPTLFLSMNKELLETDAAINYLLEKDKMILDFSNLLYVSTTRPRERLYIFTKKETIKTNSEISVYSTLTSFCEENQDRKTDEICYEWGYKQKKPNIVTQKKNYDSFINRPFSPPSKWREKLIVQLDSLQFEQTESRENAQHFGTLLHKVIALIKNADQDLSTVITQLKKAEKMDQHFISELEKQILSILNNPNLKEYFSQEWKTMNESEIILKNGKTLRPDKVLIQQNRAVVIDFKTGLRSPKHNSQITAYTNTLKEMGYTVEKALIYYTDEDLVVYQN